MWCVWNCTQGKGKRGRGTQLAEKGIIYINTFGHSMETSWERSEITAQRGKTGTRRHETKKGDKLRFDFFEGACHSPHNSNVFVCINPAAAFCCHTKLVHCVCVLCSVGDLIRRRHVQDRERVLHNLGQSEICFSNLGELNSNKPFATHTHTLLIEIQNGAAAADARPFAREIEGK